MRIVCISDTHTKHAQLVLPEGDVLVHCGDATSRGERREYAPFHDWMGDQPYKHKILIAGNHDWHFSKSEPASWAQVLKDDHGITYLHDSGVTVDGFKFWGSPWQPAFCNWAFNLPRGERLREKWALIPADTNVLLTHGPPLGVGDCTANGERVGCRDLAERVKELPDLRLHVFGHIHYGYGLYTFGGRPRCVNAASCDESYVVNNEPIVVDL